MIKGAVLYSAVKTRGRRFPGGPLRSLTFNAADSGSIPGWEHKISPAVWPEDKKKKEEERESNNHGVTERSGRIMEIRTCILQMRKPGLKRI